jgi:hypothetical protein
VFIEQINKHNKPEQEKKRLERIILQALDKYFSAVDQNREEN